MGDASNPVVSVIVPARNEEACLGACLESLVTQTGIEFEIVVVDDASTDHTAEIARTFARSSERDGTGKGTSSAGAELDCSSTSRDDPLVNHPAASGRVNSRRESTAAAVSHGAAPEGRMSLAQRFSAETNETSRPSPRGTAEFGYLSSASVTVISAPPLPDGWTGKNNAMSAGAKIAKGKWLLFTDADTVHKPGSLARAVAEAEKEGATLLSYSPEQEVRTFWEKAVMPVIFSELAATYPPSKVRDPGSPIAAANGQYLMISRETYDSLGGHTKIAGDLLEDVAMARLVKSSGRKIWFRYAGDAVRTRMYRSWSQMKEGWTKNLALLFKHPVAMAVQYSIEAFVFLAALSGAIRIALFGPLQIPSQSVRLPHYPIPDRYYPLFKWWMTIGVLLLIVYLLVRSTWRVLRAQFPLKAVVTSLLGPPVFAYLLLRSVVHHKNRDVRWKDRNYEVLRKV